MRARDAAGKPTALAAGCGGASATIEWCTPPRITPPPARPGGSGGEGKARAGKATASPAGREVICYVSTGAWEDFRPDAGRFPASVLGEGNGWKGERWFDIRRTGFPLTAADQLRHTEYELPTGRFCLRSRELELSSLLKKYELGAWRRAC
ncbi:endo alpha-1,4 polygalactosaminidase [Streptomyces andamanensis]|uniref:Endo alpha-1,4 polygalactosaminidase n=1 Tax=Streptomyces andamanensis TaxID=1565035 RepID=A0ABV8TNI1_9ACTN